MPGKQFGVMDEGLLEALDEIAKKHGQSRRRVAERLLNRALGSVDVEPADPEHLVELRCEGQPERIAQASAILEITPEAFVARACSALLERVDNGFRGPVVIPRFSRKGFEGSKLQPNADVPELGWWRPGSEEARPREVREALMTPEQKKALTATG